MILCDTRQQPGKHDNIEAYFRRHEIAFERQALFVGDYAIANDQRRSVDSKSGVLELLQDVHGDHERFRRECERAQAAGIQLLVLVEEVLPEGGLSAWQSPRDRNGRPRTRANLEHLRKALLTMTAKYGVRFRFCDPKDTGRLIVEYLTEGVIPK